MALGLSSGSGASGEIRPFINYDARAGRMFRIDRAQDSAGMWQSDKVDITRQAKFIADLANIRVGWINYTPTGPVKHMVILGREAIPPRPGDLNAEGKPAFRQGFEITVKLHKDAGGGGPREFGSNAGCVIEAMDELHDAFTSAAEGKAGKLPIVEMTDTVVKAVGKSSNYKPVFKIVGWVDRPADLPVPAQTNAPSAPVQQQSAPPATGSTVVTPPVAPQPAGVSADDGFG